MILDEENLDLDLDKKIDKTYHHVLDRLQVTLENGTNEDALTAVHEFVSLLEVLYKVGYSG